MIIDPPWAAVRAFTAAAPFLRDDWRRRVDIHPFILAVRDMPVAYRRIRP